VQQACPLFVPLAEEGWNEGEIAELAARRYLGELPLSGIDAAILGCTHYPLLKDTVAKVLGPGITLVDSAHTTAEAVAELLADGNLLHLGKADAPRYLLTDANNRFGEVGARFLGRSLGEIELVDL
jgi:glutamate racemase